MSIIEKNEKIYSRYICMDISTDRLTYSSNKTLESRENRIPKESPKRQN
jgi:hypothetical protein